MRVCSVKTHGGRGRGDGGGSGGNCRVLIGSRCELRGGLLNEKLNAPLWKAIETVSFFNCSPPQCNVYILIAPCDFCALFLVLVTTCVYMRAHLICEIAAGVCVYVCGENEALKNKSMRRWFFCQIRKCINPGGRELHTHTHTHTHTALTYLILNGDLFSRFIKWWNSIYYLNFYLQDLDYFLSIFLRSTVTPDIFFFFTRFICILKQ